MLFETPKQDIEKIESNAQQRALYCGEETIEDSDFIGFFFGDKHSSNFGIVRVSEGDGLQDSLSPEFEDKIEDIPGGDGKFFFSTNYTQKTFSIKVGFDSLTEDKLRRLRAWLNAKEVKKLTFDEWPYKYYFAKIQQAPQFTYMCFEGPDGERIYRGTGTIQFICYDPFGHCDKKFLDEYNSFFQDEWNKSAGLLKDNQNNFYDVKKQNKDGYYFNIYNPGDFDTDFLLYLNFKNDLITNFSLGFYKKEETAFVLKHVMKISDIIKKGSDMGVRINTKNHLIEGYDSELQLTGNIYNEYIFSGDFFKIPQIRKEPWDDLAEEGKIVITNDNDYDYSIKYDYLYY